MVFPGRLSTGCKLCRSRKVKCDGAKPRCLRCTRAGRECPGYADSFVFRSENERLDGKRAYSWSDTRERSLSVGRTRSNVESPPLRVLFSLPTDWENTSLCYFMNSFVYSGHDDIFHGHLHFLPQMYSKARSATLATATLSVSYLAAYNRWKSRGFFNSARKHYGIALKHLQATLKSSTSALNDDTFATILVLALFVDMSNERRVDRNPHISGIHQLLLLRGAEQFSTTQGSAMAGYALTQLCIEYMVSKDSTFVGLEQFISCFQGPTLLDQIRRMSIRQIILCCQLKHIRDELELASIGNSPDMINSAYQAIAASLEHLNESESQYLQCLQYWLDLQHTSAVTEDLIRGTAASLSLIPAGRLMFCWELMRLCEVLKSIEAEQVTSTHSIAAASDTSVWLQIQVISACRDIWTFASHALDAQNTDENARPMAAIGHLVLWPLLALVHCPLASEIELDGGRQMLQSLGEQSGLHTAYRANGSTWFS